MLESGSRALREAVRSVGGGANQVRFLLNLIRRCLTFGVVGGVQAEPGSGVCAGRPETLESGSRASREAVRSVGGGASQVRFFLNLIRRCLTFGVVGGVQAEPGSRVCAGRPETLEVRAARSGNWATVAVDANQRPGTRTRRAPGTTSKVAGVVPTCSPSSSIGRRSPASTSTRAVRTTSIFGCPMCLPL
jgi:hypothetical protein